MIIKTVSFLRGKVEYD